uniref:Uncharacterized protein n=1 Tax=Moniliophthora roreri TaxID=221103 RepID=A0A0W0FDD3_MONRR
MACAAVPSPADTVTDEELLTDADAAFPLWD